MIKIDRHISDLLYDHDCVIVPEMGGFLGSYSPASIHPVQHTFSPPSKKIAFNVFLKHNDGLLADYVAQHEGLSYNEALKEIKDYVEQYYHELEAGQKFIIEKVGILYMDAERHIQFEAFKNINYLRTSFGFSAIQCLPVSGETGSRQKEFTRSRPAVHVQPKAFSKTGKGNAVNALLLVGSILWFGMNVYFVSPAKINFASLNPFDTVVHTEPARVIPSVSNLPKPAPAHIETVNVKPATPVNKDSVAQPGSQGSASGSSFEAKEPLNSADSFFLIGGAFKSMTNAKKMADELKAQGFAEATIIENKNGFKMVSYGGFNNRDDAFAALSQLKEKEKGAWIYAPR